MTAYRTVSFEWKDHDISMTYSAKMEWDDYGVPGSPRWLTPSNVELQTLSIDDREYKAKQLKDVFLQDELSELDILADDLLNATEEGWEEEEQDPPERDD